MENIFHKHISPPYIGHIYYIHTTYLSRNIFEPMGWAGLHTVDGCFSFVLMTWIVRKLFLNRLQKMLAENDQNIV